MKVNGIIKTIGDVQQGTSKAGKEWQKLTFTITNNDGYEGREQLYAFDVFGDEKVGNFTKFNKVGKEVEVSFSVQTNEWKGKYFTTLQAFKVFGVKEDATATQAPTEAPEVKDLPF